MEELHVYDGVILYLVTFDQRTLNEPPVLPPLHFALIKTVNINLHYRETTAKECMCYRKFQKYTQFTHTD